MFAYYGSGSNKSALGLRWVRALLPPLGAGEEDDSFDPKHGLGDIKAPARPAHFQERVTSAELHGFPLQTTSAPH